MPVSRATSDGLWCLAVVADAVCIHLPTVVDDLKPRGLPEFEWVKTVLGKLKSALVGAFCALRYRTYRVRYLAAFT